MGLGYSRCVPGWLSLYQACILFFLFPVLLMVVAPWLPTKVHEFVLENPT